MRLLVVTQSVDTEDPILGFFVRWTEEFSKQAEHVEVICLRKGKYELPENVSVHSLGKEKAPQGSLTYALRFIVLAWKLRHEYDLVFVHMNQEYVLLAGWLWKLLRKKIYLWRNHYEGSFFTDAAAIFCTKIFCTSKHSYTAKYKKTIRMPVGVDTERFSAVSRIQRKPNSILFFSRMAPSKRLDILLDALEMLARQQIPFTATFVGSPLPEHESYYEGLRARAGALGLGDSVKFLPGVPNTEAPNLYQSHQIFVNCSPSGMFDKTLFEAAACGCTVLTTSEDFKDFAGEDAYFGSSVELSLKLRELLTSNQKTASEALLQEHSLNTLISRLSREMRAEHAQRILIVIPLLRRGGGAEKVASWLSRALANRNWEVHVATFWKREQEHPVGGIRHELRGKNMFTRASAIKHLVHDMQPSIVLSFTEEASAACLIARIFGMRSALVLAVRNNPAARGLVSRFFIRLMYPLADRIIANSDGMADALHKDFHFENVSVVKNPCDPEEAAKEARDALPLSLRAFFDGAFVFSSIGRLIPQKGQRFMLRAFAELLTKRQDVRLVIIGGGVMDAELKAYARELAISKQVLFTGIIDNVYPVLGASKCFVFPSLWEGFPNALLEALCLRLPVIAFDCDSGPRDLLAPDISRTEKITYPYRTSSARLLPVPPQGSVSSKEELLPEERLLAEAMEEAFEGKLKPSTPPQDLLPEPILKKWENVLVPFLHP